LKTQKNRLLLGLRQTNSLNPSTLRGEKGAGSSTRQKRSRNTPKQKHPCKGRLSSQPKWKSSSKRQARMPSRRRGRSSKSEPRESSRPNCNHGLDLSQLF